MLEQIEIGLTLSGTAIAELLELRDELARTLARFFTKYDLLLCPTTPVEAWSIDQLGPERIGSEPAGPRGYAGFTPIFNYCGIPALSPPCGYGRKRLPVGIQIVGERYSDGRVIQAAAAMEQALDLHFATPMLMS
ncbi:amidase family protein [Pseudomonas asuensis]|uniref:amidase family protein n=1 Tax=Pseudomonas asuensis TaxID=1825787 RepID=UPI0016647DA5|nr:amidase family protein [Pseudomonas asuensis]